MRILRHRLLALVGAAGLALSISAPAGATHGGSGSPELEVVGRFEVPIRNLTSDVWALGNHAYLGSFQDPFCSFDITGVRIIDISDPTDPQQVGFIPAKQGSRNNDVKVEHIETPHFNGDILVATNEPCLEFHPRLQSNGRPPPVGRGGIVIWDVSNPMKPKSLKQNFIQQNGIHNTFIWQQGDSAYLMAVDDVAARDVIIVDITKPQSPKVLTRTGAPDWPGLDFGEIEGPSVFLHDMWVQEDPSGNVIAYLSYWDAGLVLLDVTDPANPVFLGDSTYPNPDVVSGLPPEGNSHVTVPNADGSLVIMGDEDQSKFSTFLVSSEGTFKTGVALFGPDPITSFPTPGDIVDTGGLGCSTGEIPPADATDPDPQIALIERGVCFFSTKAFNAQQQGYDAYIVFNSAAEGDGLINMSAGTDDPVTIPGIFVGRTAGLTLQAAATPTADDFDAIFDGEGFMRVMDVTDPSDIVQIGHFETEGVFSLGPIHGDRTAHNVIVRDTRAYWSWYYEGMRVVDFSNCSTGAGFESCTPTEIAHWANDDPAGGNDFDAPNGSSFWGVFVHDHPDGNTYILGSDRHHGLWIFRDPT